LPVKLGLKAIKRAISSLEYWV
jgi:hypothetical protein